LEPTSNPHPVPTFKSGTAANNHRVILGQSGSGKSKLADTYLRGERAYVLLVDPNRNWDGSCEHIKDVNWRRGSVVSIGIDYTQPEKFSELVEYLFTLYRRMNYQYRIAVYIDEADLFCNSDNGGDIETLMAQGRRFFDVTLIATKASRLRTAHGYVALSQARKVAFFNMYDMDLRCIEENVGVQISPEVRAHIRLPYHYAVAVDGKITPFLPVKP
jgi:hypothetical protein